MPPELLHEEIQRVRQATDKPFAVNLITIAPNYKKHLRVAAENRVPFIVFAGSFPRRPEIRAAKESGARVMSFASTESIARHLIDNGVDALILEGSEAGGHVGHVSLGILLQQVLFRVKDVPIFTAGGIATGAYIAHLLLMGAAGVQLGTYFVCTEECRTHPRFKEAFLRARARDAVSTPQISSDLRVVAVRALRNKGLDEFNQAEAQYEVESFWVGALRKAVQEGDTERGSVMAGQSIGLVKSVRPLREALGGLIRDTRDQLARVEERMRDLGAE
jgi:enoyl-[acyl-carrier protein] reductase II